MGTIEEGWISIDELQNVWCEAIRKLEQEVYPPKCSPNRASVISFFETIKYECFKRAKPEKKERVKQYNPVGKNPEPSNPEQDENGRGERPDPSDINRKRWEERTKLGRMHAMAGLGGKDG